MSKSKFKVSSLKPFGLDIAGLDKDAIVERKYFTPEIKIFEEEEKTIVAKISCHDIDADGDLVYAGGCDVSRYQKNPVIMFAHDYSKEPIGKATELRITQDGVEAKIKFADTSRANDMWSLVKGGFLRAHSVGFITRKELINGTKECKEFCATKGLVIGKECKRVITDWLLLEDSLVPIPSNPETLTQAISSKSISVSDSTMHDIGMDKKEVPANPLGNTDTDNTPTIVSAPSDPAQTVNLTINDAVSLFDINKPVQICSDGQTYTYASLAEFMSVISAQTECSDKMDQTVQVGEMVQEERATPNPTTDEGSNGDNGASAKEEVPVVPPVEEAPKYVVVRGNVYVLSDEDKEKIKIEAEQEVREEMRMLKKGKVI